MAVVDNNVRIHHSSIVILLFSRLVSSKVQCDFAELFEAAWRSSTISWASTSASGRFIGLFEAFVSEPEDVEARLSRLVPLRN